MKKVSIKRLLAGFVAFAMTVGTANIAVLAENDIELSAVGDSTVTVYPTADIQFRADSNTDYSTTNSIEIRHKDSGDNGFIGGLKFDLNEADKEYIKKVSLEFVTEVRNSDIAISVKPFSAEWSEGSGNKYTDKSEIINEAIAADSIADFKVTYGGKKLFETGVTDGSGDISSWTSSVNITSYVTEQLENNNSVISLLLTPKSDVTGTNGVSIFTKDVSRNGYGTNASRWDAIMSAFSAVEADNKLLYPRLKIEYYQAGEIPAPDTVEITGDTEINSFGIDSEHKYTAVVKDQFDNEMTAEAVTWSVDSADVSINENTGVLTVPENTTEHTVTVTATSVTDGEVFGTLEVNIICEDTSLKSELVTGVRMRGNNAANPNNLLYTVYPEIGNELGMNANAVAILRFDISNTDVNKDHLSKITLNLSNTNNSYREPLGAWIYAAPDGADGWNDVDWTNTSADNKIKVRSNVSLVLGTDSYQNSGISGSNMTEPLTYANMSDGVYALEFSGDALKELVDSADENGIVDILVTRGNTAATTGRTDVDLANAYLSMEYSEPESIKIFKGASEVEEGESIELDGLDLPAQFNYSAKVYNTDGNEMSLPVKWSFKTSVNANKVKFNTDTGKMTIPADAANQTITITATCEGVKKSITVDIIDKLVPTTVTVEGTENINNYISTSARTFNYTAVVKDQFGNEMENQDIEWSFVTDAEENKATFANGVLTIPANVADQIITISAKCGNVTSEAITVTVSKTILNLPETFTAEKSRQLRGFGNSANMQDDADHAEIGMYASAVGLFRFDISDIIDNGAEDAVEKIEFTAYKQTGTGIEMGLWEYANPNDTERTDEKTWNTKDWPEMSKAEMWNNYSLVFGINDFGKNEETNNYSPARESYISPITTASAENDKYTFTVTGEALKKMLQNAKSNNGYVDLTVTSADLDARSWTSGTKPQLYMAGAAEAYKPVINVTYNLPSTPRRIDITGEDTLYINSRVPSYTSRYSAAVYDQDGKLYENQEVEWSVDYGAATGIEFKDGNITVKSSSGAGTVTITAKSAYATGTKTITVKKLPDGFTNGTFEDIDDSYFADGWTPNVPYYKVNFDDTDYYADKWNDAKTNDAGTIFTRTQWYELNGTDDETTEIRGSSGKNSVVKVQSDSTKSDDELLEIMNNANQSIGVNNAKDGAYMTVGYEIPYYYLLDYYLADDMERLLSNQGLYVGLEFRNKADTAYLASVATGNNYVSFSKGAWRTYTGTFTSGTLNQINGQTRVNIGVSGIKGTAYFDYFRLIPKGIDTQTAYEGTNSMYVPNSLTWTSDVFSVEGGSYYTYKAAVKTETSIVDGQITYTFMDNNFNTVGEYVVTTEGGEWSSEDENGWKTIEGQTVIPSGATICQVTISNPDKAGGVWFDNLVFTKTEEAKADTLRITGGNSEVVIPDSGENTYQYTAVVYDQYNNVMSSDVTWSVSNAAGVSITNKGILKVTSSAAEGTVTVTVSKDGKTAAKEVSVIKKGAATEPVGDLNGSFTENDGTDPYGWTNEGRDVITYTFDSGLESWKSSRTDYGAPADGELKWEDDENYTDKASSGSMLIYNPSYNMPIATIPNDVKIQGGMPYEFEMQFKQHGVTDDSTIGAHLRYFNSTGGTIAETANILRYYPNEYKNGADENGWQKWSGTEIVPTNASTVRIALRYRGGLNNSDGYAYFDDIKVSKISNIDKDNTYNGNPSLMLVGYNEDATTAGKEYGERWVSDPLTNISAGNAYEYNAMVQTYAADSGAYLSFIFYNGAGNVISTIKSERITDTTNTWTELSGSVVAPAGAESVSVAYNLDGTGTAWISGITFDAMTNTNASGIKINGADTIKIPSGGSKTESYTVNTVNSNGNSVGAADTVITASNLPTGVTFENGVLTVSSSAKTGKVTLKATYNNYNATKTVTIAEASSSASSSGGGGGGSGGSAGSGGGTTTTIKTNQTTIDTTDTNPMGHFNMGSETETANATGSTNVNDTASIPTLLQAPDINYFTGGDDNVIFTDIDNVPWAKNSIEALYKAGVVAGKAEKIFAPEDNVTRAEFVTMLIKTFKLTSDNKENNFTDVNESDWYNDYVNIAVDKGIVSGISEDYFGAQENITRQDIAVMCDRLWNSLAKGMTGPYRASFTDFEDISEYALEAVTNLAEAGIIRGMDTGEFAPLENATRAQAAVIIYGMAVKYDE